MSDRKREKLIDVLEKALKDNAHLTFIDSEEWTTERGHWLIARIREYETTLKRIDNEPLAVKLEALRRSNGLGKEQEIAVTAELLSELASALCPEHKFIYSTVWTTARAMAVLFYIEGLHKAKALMDKGMESQCELMDTLKQQCRKQEAEIEALKRQVEGHCYHIGAQSDFITAGTEASRALRNEYEAVLAQSHAEMDRLKRGQFTEEEFQALCHSLSSEDRQRFVKGCVVYWPKLFGQLPKDTFVCAWCGDLIPLVDVPQHHASCTMKPETQETSCVDDKVQLQTLLPDQRPGSSAGQGAESEPS